MRVCQQNKSTPPKPRTTAMRKPLMDLWGDCVWFQMRLYSWCVWWPFEVLFINSLLIAHRCWNSLCHWPLIRFYLLHFLLESLVCARRKERLSGFPANFMAASAWNRRKALYYPTRASSTQSRLLREMLASGICVALSPIWLFLPHVLSPPLSRYLIVVSSNNTALAAAERAFNGGAVLEA